MNHVTSPKKILDQQLDELKRKRDQDVKSRKRHKAILERVSLEKSNRKEQRLRKILLNRAWKKLDQDLIEYKKSRP